MKGLILIFQGSEVAKDHTQFSRIVLKLIIKFLASNHVELTNRGIPVPLLAIIPYYPLTSAR